MADMKQSKVSVPLQGNGAVSGKVSGPSTNGGATPGASIRGFGTSAGSMVVAGVESFAPVAPGTSVKGFSDGGYMAGKI